jgi:eukaryotic-like serine/threonine-protein kinase
MQSDTETETSLVGSVLEGAYRIERLVAKNEEGATYEAFHLRLDKPVAVKVLDPELATSPEAQERFRREALVASGIGHPHIVQVFDHSITPTGEPFLAMELLAGEDLGQRLGRVGTLSPASTVHIVKQVASALAAAHARDIVHRNVMPANIWLLDLAGESDFVKLLGFGVSKVRSSHNKVTVAAVRIGTPAYLSPEQAAGEADAVDPRTDQWALACVAWECLVGESPFHADEVPTMLRRIVQASPPPLAARVPGLSSDTEDVLRRALCKNKDDRFPDMATFSDAIERSLMGFSAAPPRARAGVPPADWVPGGPPAAPEPAANQGSSPAADPPAQEPSVTPPLAPAERRRPAPTALLPESPLPAPPRPAPSERRAPPPTALLPETPLAAPPRPAPSERRAPPPTALLPESPLAIPPRPAAADGVVQRPIGLLPKSARVGGSRRSPPRAEPAPPTATVADGGDHAGPRRLLLSVKRRWPWVAATAIVLVLAVGFLLLRPGSRPTPPAAQPTATPPASATPVKEPPALPTAPAPTPPEGRKPPAAPARVEEPAVPTLADPAVAKAQQPTSSQSVPLKQSTLARGSKSKRDAKRNKSSGTGTGRSPLIRDL